MKGLGCHQIHNFLEIQATFMNHEYSEDQSGKNRVIISNTSRSFATILFN